LPLADVSTLKSDLVGIFTDPPGDEPAIADAWATAISNWLSSAVVPPGGMAAKAQIKGAVQGALVGMSAPGAGSAAIPNAFVAGAAALAASPANAPGVTVPPPMPLLLTLGPPLEADPAATLIASSAAAWIIAGTYTVAPASPVPWS